MYMFSQGLVCRNIAGMCVMLMGMVGRGERGRERGQGKERGVREKTEGIEGEGERE